MNQIQEKISLEELKLVLESKRFHVHILNSEPEVKNFINSQIPDHSIVGLGNSITTCRLNIRNILYAKGSIIFYSWDGSENYNRSLDTFDTLQRPEYYITRLAAITTEGNMLMKDYSKQAFGKGDFPHRIYAFTGLNRVVSQFEARESLNKYPIVKTCPDSVDFHIAILPFLDY